MAKAKARSAAQKAATKKMLAANAARRGGTTPKKKGAKSKAPKKGAKKTKGGSMTARVARLEHDMATVNAWAPEITKVVNAHSRQISTLGALVKRFGGSAAAKKLKASAAK